MREIIILQEEFSRSMGFRLEDEKLVDYYQIDDLQIVGNIYFGKVKTVIKGLQAIFWDIGLEQDCYMFVDDAFIEDGERNYKSLANTHIRKLKVEDIYKAGQKYLVQVKKEASGKKGPMLTRNISFTSTYAVFYPYSLYSGVSKKIKTSKERKRLTEIIGQLSLSEGSILIRTAAENIPNQIIIKEIKGLQALWQEVLKKAAVEQLGCVYQKDIYPTHALQTLIYPGVQEILVNSIKNRDLVASYLELTGKKGIIELIYRDGVDYIEGYNLLSKLEEATQTKVYLPAGGSIVIEETEAMTIIDVNSGSFTGKNDKENTFLQTNLEAATEIATQLRLRRIGGIILVDFIDMIETYNRSLVLQAMEEGFAKDSMKTFVLGFTKLGLLEISRKKARQPLNQILQVPCNYCHGSGSNNQVSHLAWVILRAIRLRLKYSRLAQLKIAMKESVKKYLEEYCKNDLQQLAEEFQVEITLVNDSRLKYGSFAII
ncbi:MAG: Rne/Rng family ribonuclease [Clostridia bacterium]